MQAVSSQKALMPRFFVFFHPQTLLKIRE